MTLLVMDGFDLDDIEKRYSTNGVNVTPSSARNNFGLCASMSANPALTIMLPQSYETIIVGFAARFSGSNTGNYVTFYGDNNTQQHVTVVFNAFSGLIQPKRGTTSGTDLGTSTAAIPSPFTSWAYYEIRLKIGDAPDGEVEVRINGNPTPAHLATGVDTRNGGTLIGIDTIRFGVSGSGNYHIDDLYILNLNGSVNNTFLGNVRVSYIEPEADSGTPEFVGSDSNSIDNFALLQDSGSDYVRGGSGDKDLYIMSDIPSGATDIFAVQDVFTAKKNASTNSAIRSIIKIGATEYAAPYRAISTGEDTYTNIREVNPDTSTAWTYSDINSLEFGLEVQ